MSTSPYSEDLRKKVINYLKKGHTQKEASEIFDVHRNTVSRWNTRYRKEGIYSARKPNIVAGYVNHKSIAPMVFHGSCNTLLFESWVEQFLIKELKAGQVVIMDNAAFHKSPKTKDLIKSAGCKLIFLSPYSPDLNPIEKFWANMKRWIRNKITTFNQLYEALTYFFSASHSI